jgi:NADH-quinone oxidoreductase subunit A
MNPLGTAREKFSIQFFLIGILFIIFDLEVIFLFPFTISLYHTSIYGFWVVFIFLIILIIGFIYEFSKGALKFIPTKTSSITNLDSPNNKK